MPFHPLALKLDRLTADHHKRSVASEHIQRIMKKNYSPDELSAYFLQQASIFQILEPLLTEALGNDAKLFMEFARSDAFRVDRNALEQLVTRQKLSVWPETLQLTTDIADAKNDRLKLLAHAYVQYRALYNGGMFLRGNFGSIVNGFTSQSYQASKPFELDQRFCDFVCQQVSEADEPTFIEHVKNAYEMTITMHEHGLGSFSYASKSARHFWNTRVPEIPNIVKTAAIVATATAVAYLTLSG